MTELLHDPVGRLELLLERPQRLGTELVLIGRESALRRRIGGEIETPTGRGRGGGGGGGGLGHGELPAAASAAGGGVPQLCVAERGRTDVSTKLLSAPDSAIVIFDWTDSGVLFSIGRTVSDSNSGR